MAQHQYYVLARSLWQGDSWSPIAGGMSKKEAEQVAEEKSNDGWSEAQWDEQRQSYWAPTQDLKNVVNTIVVSKTKMTRIYGWSEDRAQENIWRIEENERYFESL